MSDNNNTRPVEILLVEDNEGDILLTQEALADSKLCNTLHSVQDGEEAMKFLYNKGDYATKPQPDIILLDLNLPKKDGREVLKELKADDRLKKIPVVVLTTSQSEEDISKMYDLHANCYISKPIDMNQFIKVVQAIQDFWFSIVKLPSSN